MRRWLHLDVIERDRALQWYGVCLALTIPLTLVFWREQVFGEELVSALRPNCWPGLELLCLHHPLRAIGTAARASYWLITLALAFAAAIQFARGRIGTATSALAASFLLKAFWQTRDYSLMGNYHYMPYTAFVFFLFLKDKRRGLLYLVFSFYWFAGLLKLDPEWLDGFSLRTRPTWMPQALFTASLAYAAFLELFVSLGLLAKNKGLRFAVLAQFALFHAFSWIYVGFFYPLTMALLLAIFWLDFRYPREAQTPLARRDLTALAVFCLMQLLPRLAGGDPAIFTKLRLSALNMYDATVACRTGIFAHFGNETREYTPDYRRIALRVRCDPILFESDARSLCRELRRDPAFTGLDIFLLARRSSSREFTEVVNQKNICAGVP